MDKDGSIEISLLVIIENVLVRARISLEYEMQP